MKLSGWGRYPVLDVPLTTVRDEADVLSRLEKGPVIARGNGRAYGDSALGPEGTLDMRGFDRMLGFDPATGQLMAESGVLLADIIAALLPRGWFPAVTPGTKFVTLGGMIAADVHGKNHHVDGSMASCVDWLDLGCADGTVLRCSRSENRDLFAWTIGGMGLTGVILRAAIRLRPVETGWIDQTLLPARNLHEAMRAFDESADATYSVAWIDCLASGDKRGRSIVMLGEHARLDQLPAALREDRYSLRKSRNLSVPLDFPAAALNRHMVGLFNRLYYLKNSRAARHSWVGWDSYFYPLDAILNWNRIYGRRGFAQFQCVLPLEAAEAGLGRLLETISNAGAGSFLAVLKRFGAGGQQGLSFPMPGYTLALDFPMSGSTLALLDRLDRITLDHGGRFYLAKDSRMSRDTLDEADPRAAAFRQMRAQAGAAVHFHSAQSERLAL